MKNKRNQVFSILIALCVYLVPTPSFAGAVFSQPCKNPLTAIGFLCEGGFYDYSTPFVQIPAFVSIVGIGTPSAIIGAGIGFAGGSLIGKPQGYADAGLETGLAVGQIAGTFVGAPFFVIEEIVTFPFDREDA